MSNVDMVNHPAHYKSVNGLETTDTGNILKYICRWPHKNGLEDLLKARWYLDHLIAHVEEMEKEND